MGEIAIEKGDQMIAFFNTLEKKIYFLSWAPWLPINTGIRPFEQ